MLRDFVLELVAAPSNGTTITLTGTPPTGRVSWATGFVTSQPVFYVLDDSIQQEWGVGVLTIGAPSTIARPTVVLGNSAGTTARLTFSGTTRCFSALPSNSVLSTMQGGIARNLLHNGRFRIQQRGVGPFTTNGAVTADRWSMLLTLDTLSVAPVAMTDAERTALGDESAGFALSCTFTGNAGASALSEVLQRIENVRVLSNKTVTISFYAIASAAGLKVGVGATQLFGTGGSTQVTVAGTAVTLTAAWARYSVTLTLPSTATKTIAADSTTEIGLWLSSGSTNATRAGSIGVQSGTVKFWGGQVELGSFATPLEYQDYRYDLANCQRCYCIGSGGSGGVAAVGIGINIPIPFPVTMRITPTVTQTLSGGSGYTATTPSASTTGIILTATGSATAYAYNFSFTASADP